MDGQLRADDGCRLWTVETGGGDPLLLCHGGPGLWDYLAHLANMFGGVDRPRARVVRWDQRGCGRSERRGPYTVDRFVADLDAVREQTGAPRVSLLGHSWGATLALRYALDHPDRVERLVYVSGTGIDPEETWRPAYYDATDRLLVGRQHAGRQLRGELARLTAARGSGLTPAEQREYDVLRWTVEFVDPATARRHAEDLATPWFPVNTDCNRSLNTEESAYLVSTDVAALCRGLATPTLIVDGELDLRPRWAVDSLYRALPNVERVTVAGAGHLPWAEDPAAFRAAVANFLIGSC